MPLADSRLGPGTLTIGAQDHSYQIANVALEPDVSDEDGTPTLAVPEPAPLATVAWALTGTAIQDFELPAGFVNYCMDNALSEVAFVWVPNTEYGLLQYAGQCQIRPVTVGGDVAVQITTDFSFPVVGTPTRTDAAAAREKAGSKS